MTATDHINNDSGAKVVFVQLTNREAFDGLSAVDFWKDDNAAFTTDLAGNFKQSLFLRPGEQTTIPIDLVKGANFLGLAAAYRDPDPPQGWRVSYSIADVKGKTIELIFGPTSLRAEIR